MIVYDVIEEALNSPGRTLAAESCLEEITTGNMDIMFGERLKPRKSFLRGGRIFLERFIDELNPKLQALTSIVYVLI